MAVFLKTALEANTMQKPYPVQKLVVDLTTDQTVVFNGPCQLVGIYVNTVLSAHAVTISDGAAVGMVLQASLAAGSEKDGRNAEFKTSLVVNPNAASTGSIVVFYIPFNR